MTDNPILYYAFCIVAILVAIFVLKRVASCVLKIIILVAIVAVLGYLYLMR